MGCRSNAEDKGIGSWFGWAGDTYHNHAHHVVYWADRDKAEGLQLMRRAAELRENAATEGILAAWTLSVERDRDAALARLKRTREVYGKPGLLKNQFRTMDDFDPVRDDPEFLAVLDG